MDCAFVFVLTQRAAMLEASIWTWGGYKKRGYKNRPEESFRLELTIDGGREEFGDVQDAAIWSDANIGIPSPSCKNQNITNTAKNTMSFRMKRNLPDIYFAVHVEPSNDDGYGTSSRRVWIVAASLQKSVVSFLQGLLLPTASFHRDHRTNC